MVRWQGLAFAAGAALGHSGIDATRKMASGKFSSAELVGLVGLLDAAFLSIVIACLGLLHNLQFLTPQLCYVLLGSSVIKVLAGVMYQRALQVSPISVTVPYLAFVPALLLLTSFFMLGEVPSPQGLTGVIIVTAGGYLLALHGGKNAPGGKARRIGGSHIRSASESIRNQGASPQLSADESPDSHFMDSDGSNTRLHASPRVRNPGADVLATDLGVLQGTPLQPTSRSTFETSGGSTGHPRYSRGRKGFGFGIGLGRGPSSRPNSHHDSPTSDMIQELDLETANPRPEAATLKVRVSSYDSMPGNASSDVEPGNIKVHSGSDKGQQLVEDPAGKGFRGGQGWSYWPFKSLALWLGSSTLKGMGAQEEHTPFLAPHASSKKWTRGFAISLRKVAGDVLEPLYMLRKEEGCLLMLGCAFLLSLTNSLDKMGAHASPSYIVFAGLQRILMALPPVTYLLFTNPSSFQKLLPSFPTMAAISCFEMMAIVCYLYSLDWMLVSYSVAAKRSNILISVLVGYFMFKEDIWRRLPYILLMLSGMALIVFTA